MMKHKEKQRLQKYKCSECNKYFDYKRNLNRHVNSVQKNRIKHDCSVCGANFSRPDKLKRHIAKHESSNIKFACQTCGKQFSRKDNLGRHLKTCSTQSVRNPMHGINTSTDLNNAKGK
jgi:uncharacterized Zn-finger protein